MECKKNVRQLTQIEFDNQIQSETFTNLATRLIATGKGFNFLDPSKYSLSDFEPKSLTCFFDTSSCIGSRFTLFFSVRFLKIYENICLKIKIKKKNYRIICLPDISKIYSR